jgi:hypothetical protein
LVKLYGLLIKNEKEIYTGKTGQIVKTTAE